MKKYSKPEIKVKEVELQHLMNASEAYDIIKDIQKDPNVSQSKLEDMFWDLLGE